MSSELKFWLSKGTVYSVRIFTVMSIFGELMLSEYFTGDKHCYIKADLATLVEYGNVFSNATHFTTDHYTPLSSMLLWRNMEHETAI